MLEVTLTCSTSEADHRGYVYSWTHNHVPLSNVKSVISISSFSVQDVGTYVCEVLGVIEIGRGNVVLEEGGNYGQRLSIRCIIIARCNQRFHPTRFVWKVSCKLQTTEMGMDGGHYNCWVCVVLVWSPACRICCNNHNDYTMHGGHHDLLEYTGYMSY